MSEIEFTVTNENVNAIPSNIINLFFGKGFNQHLDVGTIPNNVKDNPKNIIKMSNKVLKNILR